MESFVAKLSFLVVLCVALTLSLGVNAEDIDTNNEIERAMSTEAPPPPTPEVVLLETKSIGSLEDRERLIKHLLSDYDPRNYPTNFTAAFSIALQKFNVFEDEENIVADVWLRESWIDPRLVYNPEEYGGITALRLPVENLWHPDIMLYNTANGPSGFHCVETNALIFPDGKVLWVPPCSITANCNMTLDTAPYSDQVCRLKFGSWTFDGNSMDLQIFRASVGELEYYEMNPRWEITDLVATRESKFYACCVEPYLSIEYDLHFRRRRT